MEPRAPAPDRRLAAIRTLSDAGIPVRLVTGFRLDGDRLVRHRWAIAWTGRRWLAAG